MAQKSQAHDKQVLHKLGYAQELSRRMSGFSNFAISFSIICILSGGINSLGQGISGVGGAAMLREAARPSPQVVGVEWWFSVLNINATPQWLLPCHFDRADLDERDPARIRHPESASVFFFNAVPYGELAITDQVLGADGRPSPGEPRLMRFVPPGENRYVVFPGHLHHGVIGRMWRPAEDERLRVSLAINWWTERPAAPYLRDSNEAAQVFEAELDRARNAAKLVALRRGRGCLRVAAARHHAVAAGLAAGGNRASTALRQRRASPRVPCWRLRPRVPWVTARPRH